MFRVNTNNIVVTHFWVPIKKKEKPEMVSFWTPLFFFFPWMCSRGRRFLNLFFHALSLSLSSPNLTKHRQAILPLHTPCNHAEERRGSLALQRTSHATLPYAMTGQDRVTPLPLLINMGRYRRTWGLGRKKKEKKNEGTEERVFEKRERFWKKQRWMNWGFGGEKAKKNRG